MNLIGRIHLTFSLVIVVTIYILASAPSYAISENALVGAWAFEEGEGDTVKDISGNGKDMVIVAGPEWVEGKFGMGLQFDGVDDCAQSVPFTELRGGEISLSVWVQTLSGPNTWGNVISIADVIGDGRVNTMLIQHAGNDPGGPFKFWADNGSGALAGAVYPEPELEEWYHLGLVQDGCNLRSYVNGTEIKESPVPVNGFVSLSTAALRVGANTIGSASVFLNCVIDEVAVFDAALSEGDIKRIMTDGLQAGVLAVSPAGKLTTTWGKLKAD